MISNNLKAKIFRSNYKNRLYRITVCTGSGNHLLLKKHVVKMFFEYCKFSKTVVDNDCKLVDHLKIKNEHREVSMMEGNSFIDMNMKFTQNISDKVYDHEFIKFEILSKKRPKSDFKVIVEFYRKIEGTFKEETKKLTEEINLKIKQFHSANSDGIKETIKDFSESFILKWGHIRPRNLVEMSTDVDNFKKNIRNIPGHNPTYLDQGYKNKYIEPIKLMFESTQEYNLKKLVNNSNITKSIYANNSDNLTKELSKVTTKINKQIGSIGITPLMFACSIFQGFLKKDSSEKNLHIINLLLMYGADISIKDNFGYDVFSYIENGKIIFGHEKPEKPSKEQVLEILNKFVKIRKSNLLISSGGREEGTTFSKPVEENFISESGNFTAMNLQQAGDINQKSESFVENPPISKSAPKLLDILI